MLFVFLSFVWAFWFVFLGHRAPVNRNGRSIRLTDDGWDAGDRSRQFLRISRRRIESSPVKGTALLRRDARLQATNCRASATSTESPSWLRMSSPDSGASPEVL